MVWAAYLAKPVGGLCATGACYDSAVLISCASCSAVIWHAVACCKWTMLLCRVCIEHLCAAAYGAGFFLCIEHVLPTVVLRCGRCLCRVAAPRGARLHCGISR